MRSRRPGPPPPDELVFPDLQEDEGDLQSSLLGHDVHFLERTARLPGPELSRAMRLYNHSAVVKRVLAEQLPGRGPGRVAIAISDRPPSAHVIVAADGAFITCLSGGMHAGRVPVLPYDQFCRPMAEADAVLEQAATVRRQLGLLDPGDLIEALSRGPGSVDRETVRVIELLPLTYVVPVHFVAQHALQHYVRLTRLRRKVLRLLHHDPSDPRYRSLHQRVWRQFHRADGTLRLCVHLFGAMDAEVVTRWLKTLLGAPSPLLSELCFAAARHRGGGDVLLQAYRRPDFDEDGRRLVLQGLLHHALHHPPRLPALAAEVRRELRPAGLPEEHPFVQERYGALAPEEAMPVVERLCAAHGPLPAYPVESGGLLRPSFCDAVALRRLPVSELFPPRALLPQTAAHWLRHVDTAPEVPVARVQTVVRGGPRIGRNEPCPCGSGRKHKQCCLGRQPSAAPP